jgi:hypothetical protein
MLISGLLPGKYKIFLNKINYLDDSIYVDVESQKITEAKIVMTDTMEMVVYNTKNSGMPSNSVLCIAVDKNNIKWIGTDGAGIASFDGANFITYNKTNSPLPDNRVASIYVDEQNNKWIGTTYGGLVKFDGMNWTVYNKLTNSELPDDLIIQKVNGDKNGMIWIGTWGKGLLSFDGTKFTLYNEQNTGIKLYSVFDITFDNPGNMWLAVYGGVVKYDGNNWKLFNKTNSGIPYTAITLVSYYNNDVFVGFSLAEDEGGYANFYYFSEEYQSWNPLYGLRVNKLNSMVRDKQNLIWICGTFGFQFIDRYRIRTNWNNDNSHLPDNYISAMAVDNTNYPYWVCTQNGGLVKFKKKFN